MSDMPLPHSKSLCMLGVEISSNLSWKSHVFSIAKRASKMLGFLWRARKYFTAHQLFILYKAQVKPIMEYCSHVWGGAPVSVLGILDRLQTKAVRLIGDPKLTGGLPGLEHRRAVTALCLFYRYYHGKCSNELAAVVPPPAIVARPTRLASLSHPFRVSVMKCRIERFKR